MAADNRIYIDLDEDERRLLVLALNEYGGLAKYGCELLRRSSAQPTPKTGSRTTYGCSTRSKSRGR